MKKILFVCRGSVADGLGHVMRCKTILSAFTKKDHLQLAIIGDDVAANLLVDAPFLRSVVKREVEILPYIYNFDPAMIVFDLMHLDGALFHRMVHGRLSASISPIFDFQEEVNVSYSRTKYDRNPEMAKNPRHKRNLLYTPISSHCIRIPDELYQTHLQKSPLSVAISMGGTDAFNMTLRMLEQVRNIPVPLLFWILVGEGYAHSYQQLVDCVKQDQIHEIIVAKTVRSMWRVLSGCSIAILAGGITTYEAAYAGLPTINTIPSEEQRFLLRELEEEGASFCIGADSPLFEGKINRILLEVNANREILMKMHKRSKELIDGLGAFRIAQELEQLAETGIVPENEYNRHH